MKFEEKKLARELRQQGQSMNEIKRKLNVSKSSVSLWVRDIKLTKEQKQQLSEKGIKKEVIERRRKTRIENENARREIIINKAKKQINNLSERELKLIGASLYWAEGSKSLRNQVQFSNSDSHAIQVMMKFFKKVCKIPKEKFRGHIHLHPHLNDKKAKKYWHIISGIPSNQFYKTSQQQNKSSKGKKDNLPFGTFAIQICSTKLLLRIKGWIKGINEAKIKKINPPR